MLEDLLVQLQTLKAQGESFARQEKTIKRLTREVERAKRRIEELERQLAMANTETFDQIDEAWCFANQTEIRFESMFEGGRRIRVRPLVGRIVNLSGPSGASLLKQAVEKASARSRPQQQAVLQGPAEDD